MTECLLCERPGSDGCLCPGCTKATTVRLECLPTLYEALQSFLRPGSGSGQGRGSRPVDAPLPVTEAVLDLRGPGGMVSIVEDWRSALHADRGWAEPRPVGTFGERLAAAVAALQANILWIALSWPPAGAFAEEIRELANSARSIIDPDDHTRRGTRLGKCPAVDPSGNLCGAILRLLPGEKAVRCEWCGCAYPPATWPRLKAWMDEDAKAGIDAA